jgi:LysM repeat protein
MPLVIRKKGEEKKKKLPKAPPSRPRHANPKHPMNTERTGPLRKKGGGKLKMVEKGGKKVPFFAADGVGKMNKGGPVEVRKGMTLSQIAKDNNTSIQALLTANPGIKNANAIRIGQKIKMPKAKSVPGNTKTKNPYARMSKTQMNMMRSKDKGQQRAVTSAMRNEVKNTGAQTSPTPKKAAAAKDSRSAVPKAKKDKLIAQMKADNAKKPKKKSLFSRLFGKKAGGSMKKVQGYKSGGTVRGAGAATKGKRFGRAG